MWSVGNYPCSGIGIREEKGQKKARGCGGFYCSSSSLLASCICYSNGRHDLPALWLFFSFVIYTHTHKYTYMYEYMPLYLYVISTKHLWIYYCFPMLCIILNKLKIS